MRFPDQWQGCLKTPSIALTISINAYKIKPYIMLKLARRFFFALGLIVHGLAWSAAGQLQLVIGDAATVWERGGNQRPAQKGVQLYPGDAVVTGANSNAQIRMTDDTLLWLHPNSRLKIDDYLYTQKPGGKDTVALQLVKGAVRTATGMIGQNKKESFGITTLNAVIGIRGTDFETAFVEPPVGGETPVAPAGTYTRVYTGATSMTGKTGRVEVGENEAAFMGLKPGDKPERLKEIPEFLRKLEKPATSTAPNQETIALRYRAAEDIIPLVKPILGGAVLTGQGSKLLLVGPDTKRAELKAAITALDTPLRRLMVSVRFDNPASSADSVEVSSRSRANERVEQRLQVQEGQRAFFYTAQTQIPGTLLVRTPGLLLVQNPKPAAEVGSGIEVVPRLAGDRVSMDFFAQQSSVSGAVNRTQQTQRIGGTISAKLGEWVEAGGRILGQSNSSTTSTQDMRNSERVIFIKVDEVR